jgi:hypothetical protein
MSGPHRTSLQADPPVDNAVTRQNQRNVVVVARRTGMCAVVRHLDNYAKCQDLTRGVQRPGAQSCEFASSLHLARPSPLLHLKRT